MSIRDEIRYRLSNGELFQVLPTLPSGTVARSLFASVEVNRLIKGPWQDDQEAYRCGVLWDDCDRYVEGRLVTMSLNEPYKKPKATYMVRLDPLRDNVWEIRCRDPKPGFRIFGGFADTNIFLALTAAPRETLPESRDWRDARERCKASWRRMFHTYPLHNGGSIHDLISSNAIPV